MATRVIARPTARRPRNWILRTLSDRRYRTIAADLEQISLVAGQIIVRSLGTPFSHAYFPEDGVISHVCCPTADSALEVAMVGREGVAGLAPLLGVPTTVTRVLVQIPGRASRAPVAVLRDLVAESEPFRRAVTRFSQALFDQVALCAACNMGHSPLERCARWMLMIHDRVEGRDFSVTQEFLAYMLATESADGVGRRAAAADEAAHRVQSRARRGGRSPRARACGVPLLPRDLGASQARAAQSRSALAFS